jgi:hypothetical protein
MANSGGVKLQLTLACLQKSPAVSFDSDTIFGISARRANFGKEILTKKWLGTHCRAYYARSGVFPAIGQNDYTVPLWGGLL